MLLVFVNDVWRVLPFQIHIVRDSNSQCFQMEQNLLLITELYVTDKLHITNNHNLYDFIIAISQIGLSAISVNCN